MMILTLASDNNTFKNNIAKLTDKNPVFGRILTETRFKLIRKYKLCNFTGK
jgi:hypothetical protein